MAEVFNNPDVAVQSWYVIALSRELRRGEVLSKEFMGRRLAVYRGASGRVVVLDSRCAHLGADLAQGRVCGEEIECAFHRWSYAGDGKCARIPSLEVVPPFARVFSFPVEEKYGAVWMFNGSAPSFPVPFFGGRPASGLRASRLRPQVLRCHPHLLACNGLDVEHFRTLHGLVFREEPVVEEPDEWRVQIRLKFSVEGHSLFEKGLRLFAGDTLSATFTTWGGNLATIDGQAGNVPVLVLFAHRPLIGGHSASQTFLFLPEGSGFGHSLLAKALMAYILIGDRKILEGIRFWPHLVETDAPLARFIRQVNRLPVFGP